RVVPSGSIGVGWPIDGEALCADPPAAPGNLAQVQDGNGGLIVAWEDHRASPTVLYAQHVSGDGTVSPPVGVAPDQSAAGPALLSSAPNPARGEATIVVTLPIRAGIHIHLIDAAGRTIRTLASGEGFPAGESLLHWDGRDDAGQLVRSGVYFVRVVSPTQ